jgi:hypothetical protein
MSREINILHANEAEIAIWGLLFLQAEKGNFFQALIELRQ